MAKYPELQIFYASKEWRTFRMAFILERTTKENKLVCECCGRRIARAEDVTLHHYPIELTPDNYMDAMISLNPENIQLICHSCHNKQHKRNARNIERTVYIIYGPPLAGKKTLVRDSMWPGDLVVDMDAMFAAFSFQSWYEKPDILLPNIRSVQTHVLDNIKTRLGKWDSAWIIGGYPEKHKRERLATDLGANLLFCEATKDDCLRRLEIDADRRFSIPEWQGYINKWFERYVA